MSAVKCLMTQHRLMTKGIKPYVVISGRLMTRDKNGHLKPVIVNMQNADDAVKV